MTIRIIVGDNRETLKTLDAGSVQCVVTSPPYWGLRDYGVEGQIGLEETPEAHVEGMVEVFRDVRRVLRDDGTLWLNYGDSYAAGHGGSSTEGRGATMRKAATQQNHPRERDDVNCASWSTRDVSRRSVRPGLKPKDLIGMPWRVAFALQADGWYLRSDIIWHKPNPMPESVTDRPTKSHEHIFLLTKRPRYFYDVDAVRVTTGKEFTEQEYAELKREKTWASGGLAKGNRNPGYTQGRSHPLGRNLRDVWTIPTHSFPGAHFATFPPKLVEPCIKAGTSEKGACAACGSPWRRVVERLKFGKANSDTKFTDQHQGGPLSGSRQAYRAAGLEGPPTPKTIGWEASCDCDADIVPCVVLDPFGGTGTVGLVADRLGRDSILLELNPEYAAMAKKRIYEDCPMFVTVSVE